MNDMTTSKVAKSGGVNVATIRYYERRGLLPRPRRTTAGYRAFDPDAVRRLRFIKRAQALGFSLKEIKELLALRVRPGSSCADVRARAGAKLADIEDKIRSLRAMRKTLARFIAACSGRGPVSTCPILDSLDSKEST